MHGRRWWEGIPEHLSWQRGSETPVYRLTCTTVTLRLRPHCSLGRVERSQVHASVEKRARQARSIRSFAAGNSRVTFWRSRSRSLRTHASCCYTGITYTYQSSATRAILLPAPFPGPPLRLHHLFRPPPALLESRESDAEASGDRASSGGTSFLCHAI